jgi:ribosomal protein RSM22 (predicted rRNA methylase)
MRLTIPKSQGKQPFYDARKSSWGDIFPHPPKNRALERFMPVNYKKRSSGEDIGKRRDSHKNRERLSYEAVADSIREKRKMSKLEFARTRGSKVWDDND